MKRFLTASLLASTLMVGCTDKRPCEDYKELELAVRIVQDQTSRTIVEYTLIGGTDSTFYANANQVMRQLDSLNTWVVNVPNQCHPNMYNTIESASGAYKHMREQLEIQQIKQNPQQLNNTI